MIYVHGKGGSAEEAEHYKSLFPRDEVIGFDYRSQTPWGAKKEFLTFFTEQRNRCEHLTLVANSIGAFFALSSLDETLVDRAYFISPIVDMENLICNMMQWSNVTEQELAEKREIATNFGETLSWEYLCYVRKHPISWNVPTCILYGEHDNLTSIETVSACRSIGTGEAEAGRAGTAGQPQGSVQGDFQRGHADHRAGRAADRPGAGVP